MFGFHVCFLWSFDQLWSCVADIGDDIYVEYRSGSLKVSVLTFPIGVKVQDLK